MAVIAGPPGAGKTILTQQICFANTSPKSSVLYFNTLSEPVAKTLRYLTNFKFFDEKKLKEDFRFIDLGSILRGKGLEEAHATILQQMKKIKPAIVVIDSFKVFDDFASLVRNCTSSVTKSQSASWRGRRPAFLLGEYGPADIAINPLLSIVDGLVMLTQRESSGEQQRFVQIVKMRGTDHSRDEHAFVITSSGIEIYAPRVTIQRQPLKEQEPASLRLARYLPAPHAKSPRLRHGTESLLVP